MNIYKKKKMGPYKLRNLPVGGPVNMNQHQSWLMRNESNVKNFGSILHMVMTF